MNIVQEAIRNNEIKQLLKGENGYTLENDSFASISAPIDWTRVVPEIYKEYSITSDSSIKEKYLTALEELLKGDAEDVYCGVSVLYYQIMREEASKAPFTIDRKHMFEIAHEGIVRNEEQLGAIHKWGGTKEPEGLLSEVKRYRMLLKKKYNIEI